MGRTNVPAENFISILQGDVAVLMDKQPKYGDSWRKREHSAGDNLSRKWDRIELALEIHHYDIFEALKANPGDTGLIDDIRDLRNYCTLIEEHAIATGILPPRGSAGALLEDLKRRGSMSVTVVKREPVPVGVCTTCDVAFATMEAWQEHNDREHPAQASVGAEDESNRLCDCGHIARAHASGLGACLMEPNGDLCPCDEYHRTVELTAKGPLNFGAALSINPEE